MRCRVGIREKSDIDAWPQYLGEDRKLWRLADWRTCVKEGHSLLSFSTLLSWWNMGPSFPNILTIPEKPGISILWEISQFYVFRVLIFQDIVGSNQKEKPDRVDYRFSISALVMPFSKQHSIRLNQRKLLNGNFIGFSSILWSSYQYSMWNIREWLFENGLSSFINIGCRISDFLNF